MRVMQQSTDMRRPLFHPHAACGRAVRRRVGPATPECNGCTVLVKREGSSPPKMTVRRVTGGPSRCREETSHHVGASRDRYPLRQRSCPSSTPATSCSLLKVGGVCEPASPVPVICVSRGSSAVSVYVVWMALLNRVVISRSDPRRNTPCGGDVMQGELVGPAPRSDPRRNTPCGGDVMLRGPCRTES